MLQRNSRILLSLTCFFLLGTTQAWENSAPHRFFAPQTGFPDARPQAAKPDNDQSQSVPKEGGSFVIKKEVDEVVVHATVVDKDQHMITNLDRAAFKVF